MKKISEELMEIVSESPFFSFGFHHRLLNLSQVARFLKSLVEARTHKDVSEAALLMSLSRLQAKSVSLGDLKPITIDSINVQSGLCSLTVFKTKRAQEELNRLFSRIREKSRFMTITEGINEITAIIEDSDFKLASSVLTEKLHYVQRGIAGVGVKFSDDLLKNPGLIYQLLQQLALQNINVIEVASTATEFNIYVKSEDVRLTFDSLYKRFSKRPD